MLMLRSHLNRVLFMEPAMWVTPTHVRLPRPFPAWWLPTVRIGHQAPQFTPLCYFSPSFRAVPVRASRHAPLQDGGDLQAHGSVILDTACVFLSPPLRQFVSDLLQYRDEGTNMVKLGTHLFYWIALRVYISLLLKKRRHICCAGSQC